MSDSLCVHGVAMSDSCSNCEKLNSPGSVCSDSVCNLLTFSLGILAKIDHDDNVDLRRPQELIEQARDRDFHNSNLIVDLMERLITNGHDTQWLTDGCTVFEALLQTIVESGFDESILNVRFAKYGIGDKVEFT